jgi:hypothetical protein
LDDPTNPKITISDGAVESGITNLTNFARDLESTTRMASTGGLRDTGRFFMPKLDVTTVPTEDQPNDSVFCPDFQFRGARVYLKERGKR